MKESMNELLGKMIASTMARHSGLSSDDYLKELGQEGNEEQIVRDGMFTLICELSKQLLVLNDKINLIDGTLKLGHQERMKEDKENGRNETINN